MCAIFNNIVMVVLNIMPLETRNSMQPRGHLLGKGLPLLCVIILCFVTFPCGVLGHVWFLIVSIPDLRRLTYYVSFEQCKKLVGLVLKCQNVAP